MESATPILSSELLHAFVAFAETRSFTRAARVVGLSQPALFERVRRLSEGLGFALYERTGAELQLTERGRAVAAHGREALAREAALLGELRGEARRDAVTLAAGEGAFLYLLGPALEAFERASSGALRLLTLGSQAACEAVRTGEADLAVGVLDLVPQGLEARDLVRTPLCVAVALRHRLARRRTVRLSDLAGERLILPPEGRAHRDFVGRALARPGADVAPPLEADGWPLMLAFARAGLGVAVVNGVCAAPKGLALRRVPELGSVCYRLITRRRGAPREAVERLVAELLELRAGRRGAREGRMRGEGLRR